LIFVLKVCLSKYIPDIIWTGITLMEPSMLSRFSWLISGIFLLSPLALAQTVSTSTTDYPHDYHARYGRSDMNISCLAPAKLSFEKGLLQMHSFAWEIARSNFQEAANIDPTCAMAYWGVAMSYYDGLHEHPSAEEVGHAKAALAKARAANLHTERESAYISAAEELFYGFPEIARVERDKKYSFAMAEIHRSYPQDHEAAIFYALSLISLARRGTDDHTLLFQATEILEPLFNQLPEHPGAAHYLIHAYDDAGALESGLEAARRYAGIAPVLTHAQHMPSHIFAGLGMWKESNLSNLGALEADPDYSHAMMFLVYGHLQLGQRIEAEKLVEQVRNVALSGEGTRAQRRGLHAVNTWLLLETHNWSVAADTDIYSDTVLDVAETMYVRGLGAAHTGQLDKAKEALEALNKIIKELDTSNDSGIAVRTQLTQIQAYQVGALIFLAENRGEEAITLMQQAVEIANRPGVKRSPPDSGAGLPVNEVYGEILLALDRHIEAQQQFDFALKRNPNRLHSTLGLARAAVAANNHTVAQQQYQALLELLSMADTGLPEVLEAENYLGKQ